MTNLDILRAKHALNRANNLDKKNVNKIPGLIMSNGLLSTLAYIIDKKSDSETSKAMEAVIDYLKERNVISKNTVTGALQELTNGDSIKLQRATFEALQYLSYLKRFSEKKEIQKNT